MEAHAVAPPPTISEDETLDPTPRRKPAELRKSGTFRTNMRQNAAEYDEAEAEDGDFANGLSFTEFCQLTREREMGEFTVEELRERFLALDVQGTGRISKADWLRFSLRDALARSVTKMAEIFKQWDHDGSGMVDAREFRKAVRALGFMEVRDVDIDHIFRDFDEDGSGEISQNELQKRIKKYAVAGRMWHVAFRAHAPLGRNTHDCRHCLTYNLVFRLPIALCVNFVNLF